MKAGYTYIMASRRNGTLYIGVTNDLAKRAWEHREAVIDGFTKQYRCTLLVWFEAYDDLQEARQREARLKKWNRAWKLRLIEEQNPDWHDLYGSII